MTTERDAWSPTSCLLILGFLCYALPWSVFAAPKADSALLRIQGSNTIGAKLGPALVKGLLQSQGAVDIAQSAGDQENEVRIRATSAKGEPMILDVAAHGSGTGFTALQDGSADLAASSRPIKEAEAQSLRSLGEMTSRASEHIIAIDGLAVVVHPQNPLGQLNTEQVARIFAGEVSNWAELGGRNAPIRLYARDDKSGTFDTFKELVLVRQGKALSASAQRFESSDRLSDAVSQDIDGIGFIGLPYVRQSKALAIADGESLAMLPTPALIATEDYPLSRRLFFYRPATVSNPWADALIEFAHSDAGQAIVAQTGFIAQRVEATQVEVDPEMPAYYQQLASEARRLTVNFRFQEGSAQLDNKALRDLERLMDYIKREDKLINQVALVGFGDPKNDPERAALLSKLRAMAVRRELSREGVLLREIIGMGDQLPVAANTGDSGRQKNRRVEVWVY